MVKRALALVLLVLVALSAVSCGGGKKVAATVNGEPIYKEEVDEQLNQLKQQHQMLQGQQGQQYLKQFQKQVLDDLIDQKLVLQEAKKQGLKVTDKEVDDWIKMVKKQFPSEKEFEAKLKEKNLTLDQLKKNRKDQMLMQKMVEKVTKDIRVSDKEVEDYYNQHKEESKDPEKAKVRWVILSTEEKAKEVLKELQGGADFAQVVKKNTVDTATKDNGGDLGLKSKTELAPEVADVAFKLELNKLSDVIKTAQGFAIIKVEEKQPERQKSLDEARAEIKNKLQSERQRKAYQDWIAKLKKKAKITKSLSS